MKITEAISNFSDKLNRFNKAYPDSELPQKDGAQKRLEQLIAEKDFAFKKSIIASYKKYRFPYKTLGKNSAQADEIAKDEESLTSSYALFKAVAEANEKSGSKETFINAQIVTPLTKKDSYTLGDEFIFLQCYLLFEQKAADFVPFMYLNADKTYSLRFQKAESCQFTSAQKEIIAIIKTTFYGSNA